MFPTCETLVFFILVSCSGAYDLQYSNNELQQSRSLGLEEVALFLVGLGVASILGLSIVIGPLFAMFYASMTGNVNSGNSVATSVGGSRLFEADTVKKHLLRKLTEGLHVLDEALASQHKA